MSTWDDLSEELDKWKASGKLATFWWRDDDLNEPTEALDQLLAIRVQFDLPLTLAVIPDNVDPHILDNLQGCELVQHGVTHRSHAAEGMKKSEFSENRDLQGVLSELKSGKARMEELFGSDFFAVFVPPWNRISTNCLELLPGLGFVGISRFQPREKGCPLPGFAEVNTHIDPVNWKAGRSAYDEHIVLHEIVRNLSDRRNNKIDRHEPTGILTHHLMFDDALWEVTFKLLSFLTNHQAVRFLTLRGSISLIEEMPDLPEYL